MPDSHASKADPPSITLRYRALGTMDEQFVQAYTLSATPQIYVSIWGTLFRQAPSTDPDGHNRWVVTVPYGKNVDPPQGQWTWNFDTTGGSFHISASKQTVNKYPASAADHKQLIGVHEGGVDGADIVIPAMKLNATYKHQLGVVNMAYAMNIFALTGMVNSAPMFGRPAGEVLFLGGNGSDGTQAEAEVGYQFAVQKNLQGLIVGSITGINKDGHDLSWVEWESYSDSSKPAKKPKAVYIERVYERTDLASALGFGG